MANKNIRDALAARNSNQADVDRAYDDLFGLSDESAISSATIREIAVDKITLHPDDPFKPYTEADQEELAQSIKENGLLEPVLLRPDPDGNTGYYQMLSGRHRLNAFKINGMSAIPSIIKDVNDDEAIMIVTESNLKRRKKLYPSEKGWAYRLQLEAIKRQGKRSDLAISGTSAQNEQKFSRDIVAGKNNVDKNEIQRYVRLTLLLKELLELVDDNTLPMVAGVEISHLDENSQSIVHRYFYEDEHKQKLSLKIAKSVKTHYEEHGSVTNADLDKLLHRPEKKSKAFSIDRREFKKYNITDDDKEVKRLFLEFLCERYGLLR